MADININNGLALGVHQWSAWLPGIQGAAECRRWSAGDLAMQEGVAPDVSMVPAMLRRRLSGVGRQAAAVLWDLLPEDSVMPVIFCSRHGDQSRTLQLLTALGDSEALSPAAFSMSVHNSVAGVLSIAKHAKGPMSALAAEDQLISMGLLEAWGQLHHHAAQARDNRDQTGVDQVALVVYDQPLPSVYGPQAETETPFAMALVLSLHGGVRLTGALAAGTPAEMIQTEPDALTWLRWFASDAPSIELPGRLNSWCWRK